MFLTEGLRISELQATFQYTSLRLRVTFSGIFKTIDYNRWLKITFTSKLYLETV